MQAHTEDTAPSGSAPTGSLRVRVISGIVIGVVTISTGLLGGVWFTGLLLIVAIIAAREVVFLMRACGFNPPLVFTGLAVALTFAAARFTDFPYLPLLMSILMLASLAWQMRHREGKPIADWAIALAVGTYLGWTSGHLAAVREIANGIWWLVIAIGITWLADSGAYFAGRRFGRHQLAPSISPKKTWEGYIGGVAVALLGGIVIGAISPLGMLHCIIASALVGTLGTLGDLAESMFKRQAHAKDSSNLIPGHGGAFDRIDSLLWTGVLVFYYATVFAG